MKTTPPVFIHLECQHCSQPIEVPEEMLFAEIDCPGCARKIQVRRPEPKPERPAELKAARPSEPEKPRLTAEQIVTQEKNARAAAYSSAKDLAYNISTLSNILFILSGITLFAAFALTLSDNSDENKDSIIAWIVAGSMLSLGIFTFLAAQLVHIRANTEK